MPGCEIVLLCQHQQAQLLHVNAGVVAMVTLLIDLVSLDMIMQPITRGQLYVKCKIPCVRERVLTCVNSAFVMLRITINRKMFF